MTFGLTEAQLTQIINIIARFSEVEEAVIFGSRARGNHREASDIDIALKGTNLSTATVNGIAAALDETYLPFFVDVVDYPRITEALFCQRIDSEGVMIYDRDGDKVS